MPDSGGHSENKKPRFREADFYANWRDDPKYASLRKEILGYDDLLDQVKKDEQAMSTLVVGAGGWGEDAFNTANTLRNFPERNALAKRTVTKYAGRHAAADIAIGALGTFIPGLALPAIITAIVAQYPLIYDPMVKEMASIYNAKPDEFTRLINTSATAIGGVSFVAVDVSIDLGADFLKEILLDSVGEIGISAAATFIPVLGGIIGAGLDAAIAATITWRVGTMTAIYYQNGEKWCGSRKETYEIAKGIVGGLSAATNDRANFDDIPSQIPSVHEKHIRAVEAVIDPMADVMDDEEISKALRKRGIPEQYIREALRRRNRG